MRDYIQKNGVTTAGALSLLLLLYLEKTHGLELSEVHQLAVVAVVLGLSRLGQGILRHLGLLPALLLLCSPAEASPLRSVLLTETSSISRPYVGPDGEVDPAWVHVFEEDRPVLFLDLAVSLDFFSIDLDSREYQLGVSPGVGYGLFWAPSWWKLSESFMALNLFVSAGAVALAGQGDSGPDVFAIDVLPTIILGNLVGVGFGLRSKIGLSDKGQDRLSPLFSFGLRTSL